MGPGSNFKAEEESIVLIILACYFFDGHDVSPLSEGVLSKKVSPIFGFFQPMFQVMIIKCIKNQVHQRRTIYWQSRSPDER